MSSVGKAAAFAPGLAARFLGALLAPVFGTADLGAIVARGRRHWEREGGVGASAESC